MGRSSGSSCFKIIACGSSDPVDRDDLDATESKGTDKRGWSFRKRSASHRVLSNTVTAETPSSGNKQSPESTGVSFQAPAISSVSEKTSDILWTEEAPRLSISAPKATIISNLVKETAVKNDTLVTKDAIEDDNLVTETAIEDDTLVIETVTGNGTSIDVNTDESAIVIQTAIRRFLAQKALVKYGKVVKLQAAIRGHLVRRHAVGTLRCVQAIFKMQALVRARHARLSPQGKNRDADYDIKLTEMKILGTKHHPTYVSVEKLLSNNFARQLLESTPRTKQIKLKLDPLKPDSAWKWFERWMSASATEDEQANKSELNTEFEEQDKVNLHEEQVDNVVPSPDKSTAVKSDVEELKFLSEKINSLSDKPVLEADEPNQSMKRLAPEQADSDGRKFVFGSRKASNPAFIAAQSKFKELTSTNKKSKSFNSFNQDPGVVDSCVDTVSFSHDDAIKTRELDQSENSVSHNSEVHLNGSECGTELSISSTLDSPDRSEIEIVEFEMEPKVLEEQIIGNPVENLDTEEKFDQTILGTELTHSISVLTDNHDGGIEADNETSKPLTNGDLPLEEHKLDDNAFNLSTNQEPETGHQVYKSSSETSPRSHVTIPESQGTPGSQVSTTTKTNRSDKKTSSQKRKSLSANKRSPINIGLDSGLRSSMEKLPKENKTAMRRNSFGSPGPDNVDQEPKDSSSSNSLPSYMQATKSARMKALSANGSPRLSPDVHDKEIYIKKKHSPRSMSQAQQSTKGTGTNEKKWQR